MRNAPELLMQDSRTCEPRDVSESCTGKTRGLRGYARRPECNGSTVKPIYTSHLGASISWPLQAHDCSCFKRVDLRRNSAIGTKRSDYNKEVAALNSDHCILRQASLQTIPSIYRQQIYTN